MKYNKLYKNNVLRSTLLILMLFIAGITKCLAYDFSAVCSTGQTLYYNINGSSVTVTFPGSSSWGESWSGYTQPTGELIIPNNVTYNNTEYTVLSIGSSAFSFCENITSVTIGSSVSSIESDAFAACTSLRSVYIPNSVTLIGESAFYGCSSLASIDIPSSVTSIGRFAFSYCRSLTSMVIPPSMNSISKGLFYGCTSLVSIEIPNTVTLIESNAFYGCSSLASVEIPNTVTEIKSNTFEGCSSLASIKIPNSVKYIWESAFSGCSSLASIEIPNSVLYIGESAFSSCSALNSIDIPDAVTKISDRLFQGCSSLVSIDIPISVNTIGRLAFRGCTSITSIEIPNSVISIDGSAFSECSNLAQIVVESGNAVFDSRNNCNAIIETSTNTLISGCKNTVIPNSITTIEGSAFEGCSNLTSIEIPNTVTLIGSSAFGNCSSLVSIEMPISVESIGGYAFLDCSNITSIEIPNTVTFIGDYAFYNCNNMTEAVIKCITPPSSGYHIFDNTTCSIFVPYETINTYKTTTRWSSYSSRIKPWTVKNVPGYGDSTSNDNWAFIASPLADDIEPADIDGIISTTPANYDLYRLAPGVSSVWENYKAHTEGFVLENGQGYLYANKNDVALMFKGEMYEGDYKDVTLQTGWNLVGNPYGQSAYINRNYYIMNANGSDVVPVSSSYTTTAIPVCTGVVVQGASDTDVVRFTKTATSKSTGNGCLQMTLAKAGARGNEMQDMAIVSFDENAQLGKFIFNEDHAKLYIPQGSEDFAIAHSNGQGEMPLNFRTKETGTYTINFENNSDLKDAYLIDKFEGSVVDLNRNASYTFIGSAADRPDRFVIRFNSFDASENSNFAYQSGNEIIVNGNGELQVFDIMGRVIAEQHINGVETIAKPSQNGVYIFRLNEKNQKIVVR